MLSEDELAAIEARLAAATMGPWEPAIMGEVYATAPDERGVHCPNSDIAFIKEDGTWHSLLICRGMDGPTRVANAEFIAAARSDVPALVAEVRRLRAELATGRAKVEEEEYDADIWRWYIP